jgi:ABC-type glycerol-3-phosphate transport system permease component
MTAAVTHADVPRTEPRRHSELADIHHVASRIMVYLLALTAVTVVGFPLFWMVICSLKPGGELYAVPPTFLPKDWTLQNYRDLFVQTNFPVYFLNSLIVAGGATLLSLVVGGLGAYSLSRFDFFGIGAFSKAALICYMLPEVLIGLEEAAMVDGCTRLGAMMRVTVPLAIPGIVSVGVFSFNHAWNEFLFALVFTSSERNKVLPLGLATWIGQDNIYSWGMLLAGAVLVTIPVVLFYLVVQRKLVVGLAEGGTKGE